MLFWIVRRAADRLAPVLSVLVPLAGRPPAPSSRRRHDLEVYRDQLHELERDAARGLIGAAEAEEARAEIGAAHPADRTRRREQRGGRRPAAARRRARRGVRRRAVGADGQLGPLRHARLAGLALAAAGGAAGEGPGQCAARRADRPRRGASCRQSRRRPRLGCARAGLFAAWAASTIRPTAFRQAIRLVGATADREAGLGEAFAAAAGGLVTADAQGAFERALTLEPGNPKSALLPGERAGAGGPARGGGGRLEGDAGRSAAGLAVADGDRPGAIAEAEPAYGRRRRARRAGAGQAQTISRRRRRCRPSDRDAMIETMVARLDEKLSRIRTMRKAGSGSFVPMSCSARRTRRAMRWRRGIAALGGDSEDGNRLAGVRGVAGTVVDRMRLNDAQAEKTVGHRRGHGFPRRSPRRSPSTRSARRPPFSTCRRICRRRRWRPASASGWADWSRTDTVKRGEGTEVVVRGHRRREIGARSPSPASCPTCSAKGRASSPKARFGADGVFVADSVLAKHDETYMPKEVADSLKEKGVWQPN